MKKIKYNFQDLVEKYSDMIFNVSKRYLGNEEDAKDIVQESFIKYINFIKQKGEFESEEHIKRWLIRVSLNLCNNEVSSARHNRNISLEKCKDFESLDNFMIKIVCRELLDKLNKKYRNVFELFYIEDLKISDISRLLGISEANVKTRLKRARETLKKVSKTGGEKEVE